MSPSRKTKLTYDAHGNYDGIYVGGPGTAVASSTRNIMTRNRAVFERNDGILAGVTTTESGNTFSRNVLHNDVREAQDLSAGHGTAGTANTWTGNRCHTLPVSSPAGI